MTDNLGQILLLLIGVFALFIVLLVVLARIEARLSDPPDRQPSAPRRSVALARQTGRDEYPRRRRASLRRG